MHEEAHLQLDFAGDIQREGGRKIGAEIAQEWDGYTRAKLGDVLHGTMQEKKGGPSCLAAWQCCPWPAWARDSKLATVAGLEPLGLAILGPKGKWPQWALRIS